MKYLFISIIFFTTNCSFIGYGIGVTIKKEFPLNKENLLSDFVCLKINSEKNKKCGNIILNNTTDSTVNLKFDNKSHIFSYNNIEYMRVENNPSSEFLGLGIGALLDYVIIYEIFIISAAIGMN